ncbi:Conserved_hypothetical protein [Hexamita inflata]|uniref:DUF4200 domain-containing protein n=1 Tax=Hexamita inflata TaxID=28002 RepID=A0AA86Q0W2_9EUKA|nr:Conserved hypothetical protein [Hexamita inflata]
MIPQSSSLDKFLEQNNIRLPQEDTDSIQRTLQRKKMDDYLMPENLENSAVKFATDTVNFGSVLQNQLQQNLPTYDQDSLTLKKKTRELQQAQDELNERRRMYDIELDKLNQRETQIKQQRQELELSKQRFQKFVQENSTKRESALKKMEEEYGGEEKLRLDEQRFKQVQIGMNLRKRLLQRNIEQLKTYQKFLENVCKSSQEEFVNPEAIRTRFENLNTTKNQLEKKLKEIEKLQQQQKEKEDKFMQEQERKIHKLSQEKDQYIKELNEKEKSTNGIGTQQSSQQTQAQQQATEYSEILLGINNLFQRAIDISKRDIKFDETGYSKEDAISQKVKIIAEVIADLTKFKDTVIDLDKKK